MCESMDKNRYKAPVPDERANYREVHFHQSAKRRLATVHRGVELQGRSAPCHPVTRPSRDGLTAAQKSAKA
jgi:hypothetical protein